jgi:sugar phosphate isomerase/epimerase
VATLTRRRFLAQTAPWGFAAICCAASAIRATPLRGPVGIQLYAVKEPLQADPAGTLRTIKGIGFSEVETAGFGALSAQQFRRLLDDVGLRCPSAHLQFDISKLGESFEQAHALDAQFAASGSLRAMVLSAGHAGIQPPAASPPAGMSLDEAMRTAELANHIGEQARRAGLQYAYHNHDFEFASNDGGAIGYDLLLKQTDPALVKFEIDCGWMVVGGRDPRAYFERYPGRFPMIHVKDFLPAASRDRTANAPRTHPGAELGHGMINYGPIFAAAEKAGLQHYFAEQEGPFTRMSELEAARQAYQYLRALS